MKLSMSLSLIILVLFTSHLVLHWQVRLYPNSYTITPYGSLTFSIAPDEPNFFSIYPMLDGTDYAQQTPAVNVIDNNFVHELRRIVCYNQIIYEDLRLEPNEYAGLTLGVIDNVHTTIITHVKLMYDQASILILDNDSEFIYVHLSWICEILFNRSYGASGADTLYCGTGC